MNVLIVDDNPDIRVVTRLLLENMAGWTVAEASAGHEALAHCQKQRPDLLLLDVMMPVMDGLETLRRLHAHDQYNQPPTILFTAKTRALDFEQYRKLGAIGVIEKPFNPNTLVEDIRELLKNSQQNEEN